VSGKKIESKNATKKQIFAAFLLKNFRHLVLEKGKLEVKDKLEIQSQRELNLPVRAKPDGSADRAVNYAELSDISGAERHSRLLRSHAAR
jgi:hypothetical protein